MKIAIVYLNKEPNIGFGVGYIAGSVLRSGHEVRLYDTFFINHKSIVKEVTEEDFDVLMISSMTMYFAEALAIIREIKKRRDILTLVGGIHTTIVGGKLLEDHKEIDYLCIGEGESMVEDFLNNLGTDQIYDIKNLAYRHNNHVRVNPLREAEDLSRLPSFPWHLFPKKGIIQENTGFLHITATRGCPFNCTYCSNNIYLKYYGKTYLRHRPIGEVIREMEHLKKTYNPYLFYFADEMIFADMEYAMELFRTIKRVLNVPYGCMGRVEYIEPKIVDILQSTGCKYIAMGIECGSEEFRTKYLNRKMTNQQIEMAFALTKNAGIFTTSYNMIGFPFENDRFLTEQTIKLNQKIGPDYKQFSIFFPFPGTKLYGRCVEMDLIDSKKLLNTRNYFRESVLKNVSLRKEIEEIDMSLNPRGLALLKNTKMTLLSNLYHFGKRYKLLRALKRNLPESIQNLIRRIIGALDETLAVVAECLKGKRRSLNVS